MTKDEANDPVKASSQETPTRAETQASPASGKSPPRKNELREARPLLQAIFLGLLLASGLVAAAAMANPGGKELSEELRVPVDIPAAPQASGSRTTGRTF